MTLVIGMDEAGYGPNLGPLVVGLTAWETGDWGLGTGDSQANVDLYRLLEDTVTDSPNDKRLSIADSKLLYKPGGGLALLERGVLAMLGECSPVVPKCYDTLVDALAADSESSRQRLPWHGNGWNPAVPVDLSPSDLPVQQTTGGALQSTPATLVAMRGRLVFPQEFNAACNKYGSKGLALSHWTLTLLKATLDHISPAPSPQSPTSVLVTCDKHGGRNNYAGLLSEHFPEYRLRVIVESRPRSAYVLQRDETEMRIEFRTKGEAKLEAALASMVAKYLRELSMRAFNRYWQSHLPDLKPTAGYPVDAKRFKADIEAKQRDLGIDDDILWRCR